MLQDYDKHKFLDVLKTECADLSLLELLKIQAFIISLKERSSEISGIAHSATPPLVGRE